MAPHASRSRFSSCQAFLHAAALSWPMPAKLPRPTRSTCLRRISSNRNECAKRTHMRGLPDANSHALSFKYTASCLWLPQSAKQICQHSPRALVASTVTNASPRFVAPSEDRNQGPCAGSCSRAVIFSSNSSCSEHKAESSFFRPAGAHSDAMQPVQKTHLGHRRVKSDKKIHSAF